MKNKKQHQKQQGVALVEFAIFLPLLIFLFVGSLEFGLAYYNKQILTNASREAVRAGVVDGISDENSIKNIAVDYIKDKMITFSNTEVSIENVEITKYSEYVEVSIDYKYPYFILSGFDWFGKFGPEINIKTSTVMRIEI